MRFRHQKVFQTTYNNTHELCQNLDYKHEKFEENRHMRLEMRPNFNSIFFLDTHEPELLQGSLMAVVQSKG